MFRRFAPSLSVYVLFATALCAALARAQSVPPLDQIKNQQELDKAGAALDAALFDSYNKCDLATFESLFVDDVEFYRDTGQESIDG